MSNKRNQNGLEIYNFEDDDEMPKQDVKRTNNLGAGLILQNTFKNASQVIDDRIPKQIRNLSDKKQEVQNKKMKAIKRVRQPKWIYFLTLMCTILTGVQNIYIFLTRTTELYAFFFVPTVILRMLISLICSYFLCNNWKLLIKLYLTIDKVFLTQVVEIVSVICYVSIFIPYTKIQWFYYFYQFSYPFMLFTSIGYFRVMLVFCNWKPWQVILYKISLMIGAISFFTIGIYYTVAAIKFTEGQNPQVDKLIKDIIFLYIFAGFQLFNELFAKIDDVDGTATFKGGYKLECDPEDMELLLNGLKDNDQQEQTLRETKNLSRRESQFSIAKNLYQSNRRLDNKIENNGKVL